MRQHLKRYGQLVLERPSGTFRRVTPPSGLNRLDQEQMRKAEEETRAKRDSQLYAAIPNADCFVAPIDSVGATLIRAVECSLTCRIPVLLLQLQAPIQSESRDRFLARFPNATKLVFATTAMDYELLETMRTNDLTVVTYHTVTQLRLVITRFMNRVSIKSAHAG